MVRKLALGTAWNCLAAVAIAAASFCYLAWHCDNSLLAVDSADYINASGNGFPAIYFDTGAITPAGLYSLFRRRNEADFHVWDYLLRRQDSASRRHFHVVFSFYPSALAAAAGADARGQRFITAAEGAAAVGVAFFGLQTAGAGWPLSLAAAVFTTLSPSTVAAFSDPSPHPLFLALLLSFGFTLASYLESGSKHILYAAAVLFALLVATLELSLIVAVAVAILAAVRIARREFAWRDFAVACLLFLLALAVIWPGGWIRGGYLTSYGTFVYQALFRRGSYFGNATPWTFLLGAADGSVVILLIFLGAAVLAASLLVRRRFNAYLEVFSLLFLGFTIQGFLNKFHYPTYIVHFTALGWILLALSLESWSNISGGAAARILMAAIPIAAAIAAISWPAESSRYVRTREESSRRADSAIGYIRGHLPAGLMFTNTDRAIWNYYLSGYDFESTVEGGIRPMRGFTGRDYWALIEPGALRAGWSNGVSIESETAVAGYAIYRCHLQ